MSALVTLSGCAMNFAPLYAEMTPDEVEKVVAERIEVGEHKRDVTRELERMKVDFNFRPGEPEPVLVAFVRPRNVFYAGPDWERLVPRGLLTVHFEDSRVTGAEYTRWEAGEDEGRTRGLELEERHEGTKARRHGGTEGRRERRKNRRRWGGNGRIACTRCDGGSLRDGL